jgi:hypothetical protein
MAQGHTRGTRGGERKLQPQLTARHAACNHGALPLASLLVRMAAPVLVPVLLTAVLPIPIPVVVFLAVMMGLRVVDAVPTAKLPTMHVGRAGRARGGPSVALPHVHGVWAGLGGPQVQPAPWHSGARTGTHARTQAGTHPHTHTRTLETDTRRYTWTPEKVYCRRRRSQVHRCGAYTYNGACGRLSSHGARMVASGDPNPAAHKQARPGAQDTQAARSHTTSALGGGGGLTSARTLGRHCLTDAEHAYAGPTAWWGSRRGAAIPKHTARSEQRCPPAATGARRGMTGCATTVSRTTARPSGSTRVGRHHLPATTKPPGHAPAQRMFRGPRVVREAPAAHDCRWWAPGAVTLPTRGRAEAQTDPAR